MQVTYDGDAQRVRIDAKYKLWAYDPVSSLRGLSHLTQSPCGVLHVTIDSFSCIAFPRFFMMRLSTLVISSFFMMPSAWSYAQGSTAADPALDVCMQKFIEMDMDAFGRSFQPGLCENSKDAYRDVRETIGHTVLKHVQTCTEQFDSENNQDDDGLVGACVFCKLEQEDGLLFPCNMCAALFVSCVEDEVNGHCGDNDVTCILDIVEASSCRIAADICAGVGSKTYDTCTADYQPIDWTEHSRESITHFCESDEENYRALLESGADIGNQSFVYCMALYEEDSPERAKCTTCRAADDFAISSTCGGCVSRFFDCMLRNCSGTVDCANEQLPDTLSSDCYACGERSGCVDLLTQCLPGGDKSTTSDSVQDAHLTGGGCQSGRPRGGLALLLAFILVWRRRLQPT